MKITIKGAGLANPKAVVHVDSELERCKKLSDLRNFLEEARKIVNADDPNVQVWWDEETHEIYLWRDATKEEVDEEIKKQNEHVIERDRQLYERLKKKFEP